MDSLTGLRFLAAILIFGYHGIAANLFADAGLTAVYRQVFVHTSHVAVSFFFVVCGFVLTTSAQPAESASAFWRRRLLRVYPTHLVTLGLVVLLFGSTTTFKSPLWVPDALLLHTWLPLPELVFAGNGPSWPLACIVFFTAVFPLLRRLVGRIHVDRLWTWAGGLLGVVIVVAVAVTWMVPAAPVLPETLPNGLYQHWFAYLFPPVRLLDFVLGMLMARIVAEGRWIGLRLRDACLTVVAAYLLAMVLPHPFGLVATSLGPVALLVAAAAVADRDSTPSLLRTPGLVALGRLAFAFSLVHFPIILIGRQLVGADRYFAAPAAIGITFAELAVSVLVAWLVHVLVERPCMRIVPSGSHPRATEEAAARG